MLHPRNDLGANVVQKLACSSQTAAGAPLLTTAAATEDNVKVTGESLDRYVSDDALALSCAVAVVFNATLADTETIAFAVEYEDSADGSTWNTAVALQAATVAATGDGVSTEFTGTVEFALNLQPRERYIRFNVTPDLSASGTDTSLWAAIATLSGYDVLPQ